MLLAHKGQFIESVKDDSIENNELEMNEIEREQDQSLEIHLKNVSKEMKKELMAVSFSMIENLSELLDNMGTMHDIGKATKWFQNYLCKKEKSVLKNHAMISAAIFSEHYELKEISAFLATVAIARHHGDLQLDLPDHNKMQWENLKIQYEEIQKQLKKEDFYIQLDDKNFDEERFLKFWRKGKRVVEREKDTEVQIQNFFLLQFLFSKLIAADKKDSADILKLQKTEIHGNVEKYLGKKAGNTKDIINSNREQIKQTVLNQIEELTCEQVKNERIFTLTAPTGTGKTLTSIAAALKLSAKMESIGQKCTRIIAAVPFLNILEQTAKDFQEIFGEVMVDSSAADPVNNNNEEEEEISLQKKMLLVTSWSAPVILSTFVQLFESIITDKNHKLIKLSNLAGAIVILDEVQALTMERFPTFAVVIDSMARYYGTRFILMTATQPKLFQTMEDIVTPLPIRELLPDYKKYFANLHRTSLIPVMDIVTSLESLVEFIQEKKDNTNSILIVVNTIADSIALYQQLMNMEETVLYLSTNIISADRKKVIQTAKNYLKEKKSFIMVSTQTIEAGVDLDFDMAFRDVAPLTSIIQTAGRVNRSENKGNYLPVYIFDTGSCKNVYSYMSYELTKELIQNKINECDYQNLIDCYYENLLNGKVTMDMEILEDGILPLDYSIIKQFKMIPKDERQSIIFIKDKKIEEVILKCCNLIIQAENSYETKAEIKKCFEQIQLYTVDVYPAKLKLNRPIDFASYSEDICGRRIHLNYFIVPFDDLERYYDTVTGFIAEDVGAFMY